jgi:rhodanese-related sulfurtransferase
MRAAILLGVTVGALASLALSAQAGGHTKDTPKEVKKAVADGKAVLIDVREKSEWDDGHLKDAKLLQLSVLKAGAKSEDLDRVLSKDKIVYLHCASGVRCLKAADILKKDGFDVRPLKEGYKDLLKAGFQQAEKPPAKAKEPEFEVR